MSSMKVNLNGLIANAAQAAKNGDEMYGGLYAYSLEELKEHIIGLINGEHTIDEFAEHYCIKRKEGSDRE